MNFLHDKHTCMLKIKIINRTKEMFSMKSKTKIEYKRRPIKLIK